MIEMHTDGGYGSKDNDKKFEQLEITQVTTAIRGRQNAVETEIEQISQNPVIYSVKCPLQKAFLYLQNNVIKYDLI